LQIAIPREWHGVQSKGFCNFANSGSICGMTRPLAIVFYERLMPGSQLVNRLQDLNYRVLAVNNAAGLAATVRRETPLLLLADLSARSDIHTAIEKIKEDPATRHLPVIAFAPDNEAVLLETARQAGANFTIADSGLGSHLSQLVDQALHVE
jgi:CheY-like chemotaxis protein